MTSEKKKFSDGEIKSVNRGGSRLESNHSIQSSDACSIDDDGCMVCVATGARWMEHDGRSLPLLSPTSSVSVGLVSRTLPQQDHDSCNLPERAENLLQDEQAVDFGYRRKGRGCLQKVDLEASSKREDKLKICKSDAISNARQLSLNADTSSTSIFPPIRKLPSAGDCGPDPGKNLPLSPLSAHLSASSRKQSGTGKPSCPEPDLAEQPRTPLRDFCSTGCPSAFLPYHRGDWRASAFCLSKEQAHSGSVSCSDTVAK